jgi:hypothetical protein
MFVSGRRYPRRAPHLLGCFAIINSELSQVIPQAAASLRCGDTIVLTAPLHIAGVAAFGDEAIVCILVVLLAMM